MTNNIHSNNLIRILSIFLTPFIISYLSIFLLTESFELTLFHLGAFPVFSTLTVFFIFQYFFVYIQDERMHKLYFKSSIFIAFTFILFFLLEKNPEKTIFDIDESELPKEDIKRFTYFLDFYKEIYNDINDNATNKNSKRNDPMIEDFIKIGNKINECYYDNDCRYMKNVDLNESIEFAPEFLFINQRHLEILDYF